MVGLELVSSMQKNWEDMRVISVMIKMVKAHFGGIMMGVFMTRQGNVHKYHHHTSIHQILLLEWNSILTTKVFHIHLMMENTSKQIMHWKRKNRIDWLSALYIPLDVAKHLMSTNIETLDFWLSHVSIQNFFNRQAFHLSLWQSVILQTSQARATSNSMIMQWIVGASKDSCKKVLINA